MLDLGPIGVLNDLNWPFHNATRTVHYDGGQIAFKASDARTSQPVTMKSPWYNLDDRLGIVCLQTNGAQVYDPRPTTAKGRLEQIFHLNQVDVKQLNLVSDRPFATTALVFYPGETAKETGAFAKKCNLGFSTSASIFRITLEDGAQVDIDLNDLKLSLQMKKE